MPDGEHAPMNAMQAAGLNAAEPTPLVNTRRIQLGDRNDAVLPGCNSSNHRVRITLGAFPTHVGG